MAKILSFVTLVLVTGAFGVLFFEVTSTLLLPLFLAMVSVVMFRPFHIWCERLLGGRNRVAAVISMIAILLLVIAPSSLVLLLAGNEAAKLMRNLDDGEFQGKLLRARSSLGLDYPHVVEMRFAERSFERLMADARQGAVASGNPEALLRLYEELQRLQDTLSEHRNSPAPSTAEFMLDALVTARDETPGTLAYQQAMEMAARRFREYRIEFLGGATRAVVRDIANPTPEEIRNWTSSFFAVTPGWISSYGGRAGIIAGQTVFAIMIFLVTMYFLFADGPRIAKQLMTLSPLEERYVEKLLEEFSRVSRAVVSGSLAAAVAQGMLAGVGFQIAGLESVFLLTAVTALAAMIPFAGAAIVWLPASLWLIFIDDRPTAGIVLMVYGASVISTIDNVIKPWVLHDRSSMHPLAALIGVLGGIQALGPLGVFVGPMVIAFLQTLLGLLHREIQVFSVKNKKTLHTPELPAESSELTVKPAADG